jgi:branched-subunit amino acid ABC-type transport system permease component
MDWINSIVQGILLGGLYALFAAGLSLIFGVMRLVNIAHGDLIILAAYMGLSTTIILGIHPILALLIVIPIMSGLGYLLQRTILNRTLGDDLLPPLLVTFGLSVIIQNVLLVVYSADPQKMFNRQLIIGRIANSNIWHCCCGHCRTSVDILQNRARACISRRVRQPRHCSAYGP